MSRMRLTFAIDGTCVNCGEFRLCIRVHENCWLCCDCIRHLAEVAERFGKLEKLEKGENEKRETNYPN